jgi:hypothetical protein
MSDEHSDDKRLTRLSFIKASAGAAAGAAAIGVPAAAVMSEDKQGAAVKPSSAPPREPVMAYVRDAKRGEVTVMSGTSETTYRDPALAKRLLAAAPEGEIAKGGGIDVVAP